MSKKLDLPLTSLDELFTIEEQRQEDKLERVQEIPVRALRPFQNHPFKVLLDEKMNRLCESIKEYGVLSPLMARPLKDGGYEIVSGHATPAAWPAGSQDAGGAHFRVYEPQKDGQLEV